MSGTVHFSVHNGVGSVIFDRPEARNAMTWEMYGALGDVCKDVADNPDVRVLTLRGAGDKAFIAGTDIEQFRAFDGGKDGLAYEKVIDARVGEVERLPVPTIAILNGATMGGGLAIAAACDFRVATPTARFGVPIARTLGNCLSMSNTARVISAFGLNRAKRMLMLAEIIDAGEAHECGFVTEIAEPDELETRVGALVSTLSDNAPLTMRVVKESARRLLAANLPDGDDLVEKCYGSDDFKIGVEAFLTKQKPIWTGG
ncbi:enoyl-CoA hydratase/isomerase family protein [Mycobacterium sp. NPDC003449]